MPLTTRLGYRFLGLDTKLKVFPILQWFGVSSRTSLQRSAQRIFEWNPDRLIVGHGKPMNEIVYAQLREAFRWLDT